MARLTARGSMTGGVFIHHGPGLTVVRTDRAPGIRLEVSRDGQRYTTPGEVAILSDDAALARWACRLAAERGGAVELVITHNKNEGTK